MSGFVKRGSKNVNPAGGINPAQSPNVGQFGWTSFDAGNVNQIIQYVDICKDLMERTKGYADYVELRFSELQDFMTFIETVYGELKPIIDEIQPIYRDIIVRHEDVITRHIDVISLSNQVTGDKIEINEIKANAITETTKIKDDAIAATNKIKADAIAETLKIKQDAIADTTTIKNQATAEANRAKTEADRAAAEAVKSANSATASANSATNSGNEATKAAASAKDAADIAEELRKGQVYRGTWNLQGNGKYPPEPDTNSVWDITLNEGSTEYQFDGKKWYWGDRLLYLKDNPAGSRFSQIESGSTVISVNGKGGAVTLDAADVGAARQFIPLRAIGSVPTYVRLATLATTDSDCSFVLGGGGDHGKTGRAMIFASVATRGSIVTVDAKKFKHEEYGAAIGLFHRTSNGVVEVWLRTPSYQLFWGLTVLSKHSTATFTNDQATTTIPTGLEEDTIHVVYSTDNKPSAADVGAIAVGSNAASVGAVAKAGDTMTGPLILNQDGYGVRFVGTSSTGYLQAGNAANSDGTHKMVLSGMLGKPLSSFDMIIGKGLAAINGKKIYTEEFKPALSDLGSITDLGGVRKSGDDGIGSLTLAQDKILNATLTHQRGYMSIYPYGTSYGLGGASGNRARMYYKEHNNGNASDLSRGLVINSNDADGTSHPLDIWLNSNKVYHQGFKPTASELGAVSKSGDTMTGNLKLVGSASGLGKGALDANNSNIIGLNGLIFNDPSDVMNEGILFPKTGKTGTSTVQSDYDSVRALDGNLFMNSNKVYHEGFKPNLSDVIGADNTTTKIYNFTKPPGIEDGKYYPILFSNTDARPDVFIDTMSSGGDHSMNNCSFKGQVRSGGWSDRGAYASGDFTIYSASERAIHSIVGASENSNHYVIYVESRSFPIRIVVDSAVGVSSTGKDVVVGGTTYKAGITGMTASGDYGTKTSLILDLSRGTGNYNSRSSLLRYISAIGGINATERVLVSDYNNNGAFMTRRPGKSSYSMMGQDSNGNTMLGLGADVSGYSSYLKVSASTLGYSTNGSTESRIYHEGFKPSLGELGGIASTGGTMTGALTINMNDPSPLVLKRASQVGMKFEVGSTTRYVGVDDAGELKWGPNNNHANNHKVYHQGFKPTAADVGAVSTTGGRITGKLTIQGANSQLDLVDTASSNKIWRLETQSSAFSVTESGVGTRLKLTAGGGAVLSGQLDVNGHVVVSQGNILKFPSANYANGGQIFTRDGGQFGSNMVITSGGNLIMGGGESAVACANDFGASTTENTIITADSDILFAANGNTWADRKTMTYTAAGVLNVPIRIQSGGTVKLYDNATKRGLSLSTNSTGYAEIVFNKDGTEQWNTGLRAYNDIDWRIGSHRIYHEGFKPDLTGSVGGKAIGFATRLGNAVDLDDYKTPGVYYQDSNNNATAGMNYPERLAGSLVVYQGAGVTQEYRVYNTSRLYRRSQYSTGAWGTWAKDYNSVDKPSLSDLGAMSAFPTNINTSVDFNNYTSNGTYNLYKGSGITWTNAPSDVAYGTMLVVGEGSRTGHFVTQTITTRGDGSKTYVRTRNDGAGAWSTWEVNYSSRNKPTAGEVGAMPTTGGTFTGAVGVPSGFSVSGRNVLGADSTEARFGDGAYERTIALSAKDGNVFVRSKSGEVNRVYHAGFKPTAADVGAYTKTEVENLGKLRVTDVRDAARPPEYFAPNSVTPWFNNTGVPSNTWTSGINVQGWTTGYNSWQLFSDCSTATSDNKLYFRTGKGSTWNTTYEVYHSGRKPTAADTGAVAKTGDNMSGKLTIARTNTAYWPVNTPNDSKNYINSALASFNAGNSGVHFFGDGTTNARRMGIQASHADVGYTTSYGTLDLNPFGGAVRANGYTVYTSNNKPSAADIGALPIAGGVLTNQLELSVRKSALVVKNQAAIRYADGGNIWFQNYAEGNELVWSTGNDSSVTRRMVLTSEGTLGLTGGLNAAGNVTANNGGSFLASGIFRTTRDINPMVEWHKPGVSAYIQYIDNNNQLKIGTSNGAGTEAAPVLALSPSQVYAPGNFKTVSNSGRAWTEVGKAGVFVDNATYAVTNGSLQAAISMYTYQPNKYYGEIYYGMFHGDQWINGSQTLTAYDASANARLTWSFKNNGGLEQSNGSWRIDNGGGFVGSIYGGGFFHDWCIRMFAPISDRNLKTILGESKTSALDKVSQMKFHEFVWKEDVITGQLTKRSAKVNTIGVIAQELEEVDPSFTRDVEVFTEIGELEKTTKTLDTANLLAVALKAIQELQAEVADLKEKLNDLV